MAEEGDLKAQATQSNSQSKQQLELAATPYMYLIHVPGHFYSVVINIHSQNIASVLPAVKILTDKYMRVLKQQQGLWIYKPLVRLLSDLLK